MKRAVARVAATVSVLVALVLLITIAIGILTMGSHSGSVQRHSLPSPELIEAINKAQSELPGFLNELHSPQPGQRFAVMGTFKTPEGNEYLWIKDPVLKGEKLTGTLDQVPMAASHRKGDTVTIEKADVVDWLVQEPDGTDRGRFTEKAGVSGF